VGKFTLVKPPFWCTTNIPLKRGRLRHTNPKIQPDVGGGETQSSKPQPAEAAGPGFDGRGGTAQRLTIVRIHWTRDDDEEEAGGWRKCWRESEKYTKFSKVLINWPWKLCRAYCSRKGHSVKEAALCGACRQLAVGVISWRWGRPLHIQLQIVKLQSMTHS